MLTTETHKQLIALADAHQMADEYRSGHYVWDGGACAIGCTIRDAQKVGLLTPAIRPNDHLALAAHTGIPELIWRLTDSIFECLPSDRRSAWPPRMLRAIRAGADYSTLSDRVVARLLDDPHIGLAVVALREDVRAAAATVAALYRRRARGDAPNAADWDAARQQAYAAWQQADAAWQQADAARQQADAARQQADAAWQQADAAFWGRAADILCEELAA